MKPKKKNIVVIVSGGMDSVSLLYSLFRQGHHLRALGVNYGQRHLVELHFAEWHCRSLGVPFQEADLRNLAGLLPGSSQTDLSVPVPEGHYAEETMKATVVPNRNMIMLAVAIGHAIAHKADFVAYGAHAGDHTVYPDCRESFVKALNKAAGLCDWHKVKILRPFINLTKSEVARVGLGAGVNYAETWSCYKGGPNVHCGRCGTCIERREAFYLAGINDTTPYDTDAPSLEVLIAKNFKV